MYRWIDGELEVLLVHPGGPFFAKKDVGAWTIPKGECGVDEDSFAAACREFLEETGIQPVEPFIELSEIKQSGGKRVKAWAFEGNCDPTTIFSNTFEMEWPPRSGKRQTFPEIDRGEWFRLEDARIRLLASQVPLVDELEFRLRQTN